MVSIIILSYNTKDLIVSCIESIIQHTKKTPYEIIVVDNASSDGSAEFISGRYKKIKLIKNSENAGFAKGVNIGVAHAQGEHVLFLNSDAILKNDAVNILKETISSDEKIGVAGGVMKNPDGTIQRSYSRFYDVVPVILLLFGGDTVELLSRKSLDKEVTDVDWVSGGFMMVNKSVFNSLKGFDEHFFMYIEDMELCKRVNKAGYRVVVNRTAEVAHKGHGSSNRQFAIVNIYKGLLYYYSKHKNVLSRCILMILLAIKAGVAMLVGLLTGNKTMISTYIAAIKTV